MLAAVMKQNIRLSSRMVTTRSALIPLQTREVAMQVFVLMIYWKQPCPFANKEESPIQGAFKSETEGNCRRYSLSMNWLQRTME